MTKIGRRGVLPGDKLTTAEQPTPSSMEPGTASIADARAIDRYFQTSARGSAQKREVVAGITISMAMVYAVFVVPGMPGKAGFDTSAVFVVVCLATAFSSLLMGLWAKLPIAIGCTISLTAFMAFGLMLGQKPSPGIALSAAFLMGVVFTAILATGVRSWILHNLPSGVAHDTGIGIGLFLPLIVSNDVRLAAEDAGTGLPVALGHITVFPVMTSVLGLAAIFGMERRRVPDGILIVIIAISVLGLIFDPAMKFTSVFVVPSLAAIGHASLIDTMDIRGTLTAAVLPSVLALVMTAVFDAAGTIRAVAGQAGLLNDKGHIISGGRTPTVDSISSVFSAFFGGAPATTYIELTVGVAAGGKTGLTAVVAGLMFPAVMFFSPLAGLMPSYTTVPALMYVGLLMLSSVSKLHMDDMVDALSRLVCAVFIMLTYDIVASIMFGFSTLVIGRLVTGEQRRLNTGIVAIAATLVTSYVGGWVI